MDADITCFTLSDGCMWIVDIRHVINMFYAVRGKKKMYSDSSRWICLSRYGLEERRRCSFKNIFVKLLLSLVILLRRWRAKWLKVIKCYYSDRWPGVRRLVFSFMGKRNNSQSI